MTALKKLAALFLVVGLLVAPLGVLAAPTLPALKDAVDSQPVMCPTGVILKAGFDEKDGRYTLMYFGDATPNKAGDLVPAGTHVWIRFLGNEPVEVLLVEGGKATTISPAELAAKYPSPCDLLGAPV